MNKLLSASAVAMLVAVTSAQAADVLPDEKLDTVTAGSLTVAFSAGSSTLTGATAVTAGGPFAVEQVGHSTFNFFSGNGTSDVLLGTPTGSAQFSF